MEEFKCKLKDIFLTIKRSKSILIVSGYKLGPKLSTKALSSSLENKKKITFCSTFVSLEIFRQ